MPEAVRSIPSILSGWLLWIVFFKYFFGFGWPHEWGQPRAQP
jgi:hypothetical protein